LGAERLRLESFNELSERRGGRPKVESVLRSVRAGQIGGVGGLQGSGASERVLAHLGGHGSEVQDRAWINGEPLWLQTHHGLDLTRRGAVGSPP